MASASTMDTECKQCGSRLNKLRQCGRCRNVSYCSKDCQIRHWNSHKKDCKSKDTTAAKEEDNSYIPVAKEDTSKRSSNTEIKTSSDGRDKESVLTNQTQCDLCIVCDIPSHKTCSRCKIVVYCSKSCQKKHWKSHKLFCVKVDGEIKTPGSKTISIPSNPLDVFFPRPTDYSTVQAKRRVSVEIAKTKCSRIFPFMKIVDRFCQLPREFWGTRPQRRQEVLLAFMSRLHEHAMRHGVYILDRDEEETHALFYLDFGIPEPFFSWEELKPGKYICISYPFVHVFLDGTEGLRIEDPSDIVILDF